MTDCALEVVAARGHGQDRAAVFRFDRDVVLVVADGVGGTGDGAAAAQAIVDAVGAVGSVDHDWCGLLLDLDERVARFGQSTAVVVTLIDGVISGASVGDSGAWLIGTHDARDLTDGQHRKPLVGDGCRPFAIRPTPRTTGTLLVASDGLLAYAKWADVIRIANGPDLSVAARALIDLVRLPSRALPDDVAVILCRGR
jgi:serine/threonine protein phosphatase PrpC